MSMGRDADKHVRADVSCWPHDRMPRVELTAGVSHQGAQHALLGQRVLWQAA